MRPALTGDQSAVCVTKVDRDRLQLNRTRFPRMARFDLLSILLRRHSCGQFDSKAQHLYSYDPFQK